MQQGSRWRNLWAMVFKPTVRPPAVEVKNTGTAKGLGVYAVRDFRLGELVEECPVIVFAVSDWENLPQKIKERIFDWSGLTSGSSGQHALALGYGSLYNHANPASLKYSAVRSTMILQFSANREIRAGEELTINYDMRAGWNWEADSGWARLHRVQLE